MNATPRDRPTVKQLLALRTEDEADFQAQLSSQRTGFEQKMRFQH